MTRDGTARSSLADAKVWGAAKVVANVVWRNSRLFKGVTPVELHFFIQNRSIVHAKSLLLRSQTIYTLLGVTSQ